jgi:hypothetical protein
VRGRSGIKFRCGELPRGDEAHYFIRSFSAWLGTRLVAVIVTELWSVKTVDALKARSLVNFGAPRAAGFAKCKLATKLERLF